MWQEHSERDRRSRWWLGCGTYRVVDLAAASEVLHGNEDMAAMIGVMTKTVADSCRLNGKEDMVKVARQAMAVEPRKAVAGTTMRTMAGCALWLARSLEQFVVDLPMLGHP